jgi:hypothetical protein
MRDAGTCEHCREIGAPRLIDALSLGRSAAMDIVLCDKCFEELMDLETVIWTWFRQKYSKQT